MPWTRRAICMGERSRGHLRGLDYFRKETQDVACIELTEDHKVFIVFDGLLSANNLLLHRAPEHDADDGIFQTEGSGGARRHALARRWRRWRKR